MPFRNSNLLTLPPLPLVRIFLHGQLIVQPTSDGSQCDIGINRRSPAHQFSIEVRKRSLDLDIPDLVLLRHLGTLEGLGIDIDLVPSSIEGVRKFVPTSIFRRQDQWPNPSPEAHDLRWIVDLASDEFHRRLLNVEGTGATEPNIRIKDGVFYTAIRSDSRMQVTRTVGPDHDPQTNILELHRIASIIGVNLYGSEAVLIYYKHIGAEPQVVPMKREAGSYYEIRINNDPPYVDPDPATAPTHKELKEYYKVIADEVSPKFELLFHFDENGLPPVTPDLGSPTIPCMPIGDGV